MVNYLMEDVVVFMAEASLTAYADFIIERAAYDVEVVSPSEVSRSHSLP